MQRAIPRILSPTTRSRIDRESTRLMNELSELSELSKQSELSERPRAGPVLPSRSLSLSLSLALLPSLPRSYSLSRSRALLPSLSCTYALVSRVCAGIQHPRSCWTCSRALSPVAAMSALSRSSLTTVRRSACPCAARHARVADDPGQHERGAAHTETLQAAGTQDKVGNFENDIRFSTAQHWRGAHAAGHTRRGTCGGTRSEGRHGLWTLGSLLDTGSGACAFAFVVAPRTFPPDSGAPG